MTVAARWRPPPSTHRERRAEQEEASSVSNADTDAQTIGVEIRRGTYDVVVDGKPAGSLELNETIDIPVEPGHHALQVRNGRNSSRTKTFDAAEGETRRLPMQRKERPASEADHRCAFSRRGTQMPRAG